MDIVDRDIERAEFEATRTWSQSSKEKHEAQRRGSHESAVSSSTSSSESLDMNRTATASGPSIPSMSRARTAGDHPIAMHRTATHRLQHTHTVGASLRTKKTEKPLPEFGGGKPYPPPLPAQEEYVVEFDGKDDPLHPQNWPFKKKYVRSTSWRIGEVLTMLTGSELVLCWHILVFAVLSRLPSSPLQHKPWLRFLGSALK